jgi:hypothetical protein
MYVVPKQMIRSSSQQRASYLTIITKNYVFPTVANFCRNTNWLRCWKLYQKKKDEKTLVKLKESRRVSSHGVNKYLTGPKKNIQVQGSHEGDVHRLTSRRRG